MVDSEDDSIRISVKNLWKVYGQNPEAIVNDLASHKTKKEIQELTGNVLAIKNASFDIVAGEVFVVMGLSGCGKSTLIRSLIGLIKVNHGSITIDDEDIVDYDQSQLTNLRRETMSMIFQHYGLLPHKNVLDNASYGLEVKGISRTKRYEKAREVLDLVGLSGWEQSYPHELSGGMQQRVGLARALALNPSILLMDEPFSGLDPLIRRNMQEELLRILQTLQKTIVFITHDLNEAMRVGDRIAIMRDGEIIQIGSPEDIILNPANEFVSDFTKDIRRESILTAAIVMEKSRAVILDHEGPDAAIKKMKRNNVSSCSIVDSSTIHIGTLCMDKAKEAVLSGITDVYEHLESDVATVSPNTSFEELIPLSLSSEYPLPVVDSEGKFLGEVYAETIAEKLAYPTSESEEDNV